MTNFLHWRKTTWALVLWSGYIATWAVITGSGPSMVILWWLVGLVIFRPLWFATQSAVPARGALSTAPSGRAGRTGRCSASTAPTGRSPGAMPVESERRSSTVSEATRPAADQLTSNATSAHAPAGLDWRRSPPPTFPDDAATTSRR